MKSYDRLNSGVTAGLLQTTCKDGEIEGTVQMGHRNGILRVSKGVMLIPSEKAKPIIQEKYYREDEEKFGLYVSSKIVLSPKIARLGDRHVLSKSN